MKAQSQKSNTPRIYEFGFLRTNVNAMDEPSQSELELSKNWLSKYAKKKMPRDRCLNSYFLKHVVEDAVGQYITNGAFHSGRD
jgi:hypothetical protein